MSLERGSNFEPIVYYGPAGTPPGGSGFELSQDSLQQQAAEQAQSYEHIQAMWQHLSPDHQLVAGYVDRTELGRDNESLRPMVEEIKRDLQEEDEPLIIIGEGESGTGKTELLEAAIIESLTDQTTMEALHERGKKVKMHVLTTSGGMLEYVRRSGFPLERWGQFTPGEFAQGERYNRDALALLLNEAAQDQEHKHVFVVDMVGSALYPALDLGYGLSRQYAKHNPILMQMKTNREVQELAMEVRDQFEAADPEALREVTERLGLIIHDIPVSTPEELVEARVQQGNRYTIGLSREAHNAAIVAAVNVDPSEDTSASQIRIQITPDFIAHNPDYLTLLHSSITPEYLEEHPELRAHLEEQLYIATAEQRRIRRSFLVENPIVEGQKHSNVGLFKKLKVKLEEVLSAGRWDPAVTP